MTIDDLIEILYRCAKQFIALIDKKRAGDHPRGWTAAEKARTISGLKEK